MSVNHIPEFHLAEKNGATLMLKSAGGHVAHIFVLEQDIIRVMVLPDAQLHFPRTWAIAPGAQPLPLEGRERLSLAGFSLPDFTLRKLDGALQIQTEKIRLTVQLKGMFCSWETRPAGEWKELARDRSTQAVNFGYWDDKVYHYLKRDAEDEMYFGLGERSGDANRHGRSFSLKTIDAMGYNASSTDVLYKHIPFYITWANASKRLRPVLRHSVRRQLDMGCELNNYHGHYCYCRRPRRSRLLLHGRRQHGAGSAALYLDDRQASVHAEMGHRLLRLHLELYRPAGRAGTDEWLPGRLRAARHAVRFVSSVVRLHLDRQPPLRLQLEPRQIPRSQSFAAHFLEWVRLCAINLACCRITRASAKPRA